MSQLLRREVDADNGLSPQLGGPDGSLAAATAQFDALGSFDGIENIRVARRVGRERRRSRREVSVGRLGVLQRLEVLAPLTPELPVCLAGVGHRVPTLAAIGY
ncbi:hypothetical protein [Halovenus aranensis]|uniref:hypothetical protein n=1 Tax=Halovenus aranensis TaxID=890420 RepID=UPI001FE08CE1|nr:hypothetical protein [Halovenus aranensis]